MWRRRVRFVPWRGEKFKIELEIELELELMILVQYQIAIGETLPAFSVVLYTQYPYRVMY